MSRACPLFQASALVVLVGLAMLVLGTVAPSAFAAEFPPLPFVVGACVRTATPPVLNGKLDDACWQRTRPMQPFVKLTVGTPAEVQSTAYLLYDQAHLYIGVHCEEPQMGTIKADVTQRDIVEVCTDDCIEVFLIPPDSDILASVEERSRYLHFVATTLGTQYDEIGMEAPQSFDADWQAVVSRGEASWELEMAIPFAELGTRAADGAVWTGNISRAWRPLMEDGRRATKPSTWAPIQRWFHDKNNFGRLVFSPSVVATEEDMHRIELLGVKSGLLQPALDNIGGAVRRLRQQVTRLPEDCKAKVERGMTITCGRRHRLEGQVAALTVEDFRARWQPLHRGIERLRRDAEAREDEALMLAATGGGRQPWYIFASKAITNQRLLSNRWPGDVKALPELSLAACPGEYESGTFSVYAVRDLHNVQLEISDVRCGEHTLPASCIEPYAVKCWYQAGRRIWEISDKQLAPELLLKDDDLVRVDYRAEQNFVRARPGSDVYLDVTLKDSSNLEGLIPQDAGTLLPVDIPAGNLRQFWLTAHVPEDAASGLYRGEIRISAEGVSPAKLPFAIEVHPFALAEPDMIFSIYYRAKLAEDNQPTITSEMRSEEQYLAELRDMRAHGVLYPTLYQPYHPELLPRALELRQEAGLADDILFNLGRGTGNITSEGALNSLKNDVKKWRELAAEFGYKEVYFYGVDEATGERLIAQRKAWEAVQEAGGKTFVAGYKGTFEAMGDLLDLLNWSGALSSAEAEKWHSVGSKITSYGNPQVGVEEPETYRRNFGLLLWQAGYDGAADYAYQHGFNHVWNDFDSPSYRDHNFTYPTVNGIVGTLAWEGFREAVDDVRYITTLENAIAAAGDTEQAQRAQRWLDRLDPTGDLDQIRQRAVWWTTRLMR